MVAWFRLAWVLGRLAAYILKLPRGTDTLFPGPGVVSLSGFDVSPHLDVGCFEPDGGPYRPRESQSVPKKEMPIGFYHEQTRAIKAVVSLPIGCESMAYQGIGPSDQRSGILYWTMQEEAWLPLSEVPTLILSTL